ncbi:MAG TPA: hypothetical protein DCE41_13360 [Cytophagales bacterium]|nr:hypothetical protein [Cytophagales bacterium]HAA22445.1 hypothetical protein [Cytophagales bacterium]HAP59754.1 hypothetical protein [Cytophagales bacterium]
MKVSEKSDFVLDVVRRIVANHFPEQNFVFQIQGAQWLDSYRSTDKPSGALGEFKAGISKEQAQDFVKIMLATCEMVDQKNKMESTDLQELMHKYDARLRQLGIAKNVAYEIVNEYAHEILEFILL